MKGSPPRMPKNEFPWALASRMVRLSVSRSISVRSAATSTQQPWQRRLQELRIERYRNGGKYSPRLMRLLNFSTDTNPFTPKFQANFAMQPKSALRRVRKTREGSMASGGRGALRALGGQGGFGLGGGFGRLAGDLFGRG